jgi:hypothetical protein
MHFFKIIDHIAKKKIIMSFIQGLFPIPGSLFLERGLFPSRKTIILVEGMYHFSP